MTPAQSNAAIRIASFLLQTAQHSMPCIDTRFSFLFLTYTYMKIFEMQLVLIITTAYTPLDPLVSPSYGNRVTIGSNIAPAADPLQAVLCLIYSINDEWANYSCHPYA